MSSIFYAFSHTMTQRVSINLGSDQTRPVSLTI